MSSRARTTGLVAACAAGAVLVLGGLSGCATSSGAGAGGTGSTTSTPTPTQTSTPVGSPSPVPGQSLSLSGTVEQGAEPSCLILQTSAGQYELLGDTTGVRPGDKLDVTGSVVHVMSHCMQGRPFQVTHLTKH